MLRALAIAMGVLVYQGAGVPAFAQQVPTRLPFQKTVFYGANFAGEQIDPLTGNLNYTLPLLVIPSGSRSQTALELSYNSQFWHADKTGIRSSAVDVGYGNGWMLMFGAIRDPLQLSKYPFIRFS